jgi:hypothetical protein
VTRRLKASTPGSRNPTLTEGQLAAEKAREADARHKLARKVAKYTMQLRHGCTGFSCTSPDHEADRQRRDEVLTALGIIPDPEGGVPGKYQWGRAKGARK